MKKIEKITVRRMLDDTLDTSHIGEYMEKPGDWVIDRQRGEYLAVLDKDPDYALPPKGREFRFFKPCAGGETEGTEDYQRYGKQDFERMESLSRGDWYYLGIRAEAEVMCSFDGGSAWKIDRITSGGLWGIESDSEESYLESVEKEEIAELQEILREYGFTEEQIKEVVELAKAKEGENK